MDYGFRTLVQPLALLILCITFLGSRDSYAMLDSTQHKLDIPSMASAQFDEQACNLLYFKGRAYRNEDRWQEAYDTLKLFIETCPENIYAPVSFSAMYHSVQNLWNDDTTSYERFREWIKSVLYLNTTNPRYFCSAVGAIAGTFKTTNQSLAVMKYLIEQKDCDHADLRESYHQGRISQYEWWLNGDTSIPLDTTLPSLQELGLELLLDRNGVAPNQTFVANSAVTKLSLHTNPASKSSMLSFNIDQPGKTSIILYDALGKVAQVFDAGTRRNPGIYESYLHLRDLTPGTYYVRVTLDDIHSKTIRLVKQ